MPDDLFTAAKKAMANCHAPYSNFPVGAALRTISGAVHSGCNVENASFPEGWCAETSAIAQMVSSGEKEIAEILVVAKNKDKITPCGGCRQRIAEFGKADTKVHLCDKNGVVETITLGQLLPLNFELDIK